MSVRGMELTGKRFNRWSVIDRGESQDGRVSWNCICDCGNTGIIDTRRLVHKKSQSCGCIRDEMQLKHGQSGQGGVRTGEYTSWHQMKQRCLNENDKRYPDYGGRGIKVYEPWLEFTNFFKDMGSKPTEKHSIDRIDVNGNYEPSNCKWSDDYEQQRNIRVHKNNKLGVKGVHFDVRRNKYTAQLYANGKRRYMKRFDSLDEAIEGRKQAELKYWGESS